MTATAITRVVLLSTLLLSGAAACRDVGIVGEGSACPDGCDASERCVSGVCMPRDEGAAGDDSEHEDQEDDEHEEEHEDEPRDADEE